MSNHCTFLKLVTVNKLMCQRTWVRSCDKRLQTVFFNIQNIFATVCQCRPYLGPLSTDIKIWNAGMCVKFYVANFPSNL